MHTTRLTLVAIVLALVAAPTVLAQGNAKEIMARKPAELVEPFIQGHPSLRNARPPGHGEGICGGISPRERSGRDGRIGAR